MDSTSSIQARAQLLDALFMEFAIHRQGDGWPLLQAAAIGNIETKPHLRFALEQDQVFIVLTVSGHAMTADGRPLPLQASFRLIFSFHVQNLAADITHSPTNILLKGEVYYALLATAYATARGMILSKTADTVMRGFVLPSIDVYTLPMPSPHL